MCQVVWLFSPPPPSLSPPPPPPQSCHPLFPPGLLAPPSMSSVDLPLYASVILCRLLSTIEGREHHSWCPSFISVAVIRCLTGSDLEEKGVYFSLRFWPIIVGKSRQELQTAAHITLTVEIREKRLCARHLLTCLYSSQFIFFDMVQDPHLGNDPPTVGWASCIS